MQNNRRPQRLVITINYDVYEKLVKEASERKAFDDAARVVQASAHPRPMTQAQWAQSDVGRRALWELGAEVPITDHAAYSARVDQLYQAYRAKFGRPVGRPPLTGPRAKRLYVYVQELIAERLAAAEPAPAELISA